MHRVFFLIPLPTSMDIAPTIAAPAKNEARALYSYTARNGDELSIVENDILTILDKDAGDWWRAELNGSVGLVPATYVKETSSSFSG